MEFDGVKFFNNLCEAYVDQNKTVLWKHVGYKCVRTGGIQVKIPRREKIATSADRSGRIIFSTTYKEFNICDDCFSIFSNAPERISFPVSEDNDD